MTMISSLLSGSTANFSVVVMLAKATIILVAALGITFAMQRASAGSRHLVWLVALGALLLVPALTAWAPLPIRVLPEAPTTWVVVPSHQSPIDEAPATAAPMAHDATRAVSAIVPTKTIPQRAWSRVGEMNGLELLLAVWLAVALAIVASLAWAGLAVRRIVNQASPLDSRSWLAPLWEVSDRLGLEQAPRLLRSAEAKMPFACGMLRPTIVLPAECEGWTTERRQAVLLHELAHVRRHDLVGHTLARLVCAAYWFHPLAWTAAKQLRSESERACDDLALSCGTRATDYAEHLLEIVTSVRGDNTPVVALAMARRKEFEGRMLAILDPELPHSSPSRRQSAALIGSLAVIALVVGAASPAARTASAAQPDMRVALDTGFERTSGLRGPERTDTAMEVHETRRLDRKIDKQVVQQLEQQRRTETYASAQAITAVDEAIESATKVKLGRAIGSFAAATAVSALQGVFGSQSVRQKSADDRPALLAKILRTDTSLTIRQTAAWGLREFVDLPVASEALTNAVSHDAEACVREMAAWALGDGDDRNSAAVAALSGALHSDLTANVRRTAAWSLGQIGSRAAVPALAAALTDEYAEVRQRAAWALGNIEPKEAPRELVSMLRDRDRQARELAAWSLFRIEDPATAPALEAALKAETDKEVQIADIRALAALGEKSVDAIRGLVESPDARIRSMAVRALAGGHATGPWPWPWPEPRPYP
jgi:beta-lactamase regulating signal transducer with metallopeptidase domain/HEAT repeat protein